MTFSWTPFRSDPSSVLYWKVSKVRTDTGTGTDALHFASHSKEPYYVEPTPSRTNHEESAPSMGRMECGGNMTICWTPSRLLDNWPLTTVAFLAQELDVPHCAATAARYRNNVIIL
jgi:hypothetical protein